MVTISSKKSFLTTGQVADIFLVTPDAVLKWIKTGRISARRTPGGHYRIPQEELLTFLYDGEEPAVTPDVLGGGFQYCWEFNAINGQIRDICLKCITYQVRAGCCWELIDYIGDFKNLVRQCEIPCESCEYYALIRGQYPDSFVEVDRSNISLT